MKLNERIDVFVKLGIELKCLLQNEIALSEITHKASCKNPWFTVDNIKYALLVWADILTEQKINDWLQKYDKAKFDVQAPKTIGVVMAGNIPLVGFHDFLCVLLSGNKILIKASSNDDILLPFIVEILQKINPQFVGYIQFEDNQIKNFDAVIATGSNNTARYFEYYFGKYPSIIRKNRNSVAVLNGDEDKQDLLDLWNDIFLYFGLGCRNVSKIYIPKQYDFTNLIEVFSLYNVLLQHHKYCNNIDYQKSIMMMNTIPFIDADSILLKEDMALTSPIAVLHYEKYDDKELLAEQLKQQSEELQCIVSSKGWFSNSLSFGEAQKTELWQYADGIDVIDFLLSLN